MIEILTYFSWKEMEFWVENKRLDKKLRLKE